MCNLLYSYYSNHFRRNLQSRVLNTTANVKSKIFRLNYYILLNTKCSAHKRIAISLMSMLAFLLKSMCLWHGGIQYKLLCRALQLLCINSIMHSSNRDRSELKWWQEGDLNYQFHHMNTDNWYIILLYDILLQAATYESTTIIMQPKISEKEHKCSVSDPDKSAWQYSICQYSSVISV